MLSSESSISCEALTFSERDLLPARHAWACMHGHMHGGIMRILRRDLRVVDCLRPGVLTAFEFEGRGSESRKFVQATWGDAICYDLGVLGSDVMFRTD
jgi:hypothetical protein